MAWLITKYLITALIVVIVSEVAQRSGKLGALITALPLVAVLSLIWLHIEHQPGSGIAEYARYTFWYVLPTLPMFLVLISRFGFWSALLGSLIVRWTRTSDLMTDSDRVVRGAGFQKTSFPPPKKKPRTGKSGVKVADYKRGQIIGLLTT